MSERNKATEFDKKAYRVISTHALGFYCESSPLGCGHTGRIIAHGFSPLGIQGGSKIYAWGDVVEFIDKILNNYADDPYLKPSWDLWKKEIDIEDIINSKYSYTGWQYKLYMGLSLKNIPSYSYDYINMPKSKEEIEAARTKENRELQDYINRIESIFKD